MEIVKKRNEDESNEQAPPAPIALPPLRTFVLTSDLSGERIVEAHGMAIDEAGYITFIVFFIVDGKPTQAPKFIANVAEWLVEEINPLFPVLVKN